jgi:hypothetical protein
MAKASFLHIILNRVTRYGTVFRVHSRFCAAFFPDREALRAGREKVRKLIARRAKKVRFIETLF